MKTVVSQNFSGDRRISKMNVSADADAQFLRDLQKEDFERYARLQKHTQRANPESVDESQALTNFMLGLPTGKFRFTVIAGPPAPAMREDVPKQTRHGGRPRLPISQKARVTRVREQKRDYMRRQRQAAV